MKPAQPVSDLEQAVVRTLAYGSVFGVIPSVRQVRRWLISERVYSFPEVNRAYAQVCEQLWIASDQPALRAQQRAQIKSLWQAVRFLQWIPWVQAVWVTGSVAAGSTRENDDLDFLVLTAPRRLWLTRVVVLLGSAVAGRWRPRLAPTSPQTRLTWCWNIWLEPQVGLRQVPPSLYGARELVQARLVLVRPGVCGSFLLDHAPWARHVTAPGWRWARRRSRQVVPSQALWASRGSWIGDLLNTLAYHLQHVYMYSHQTSEVVEKEQAWFHRGNYAQKVQQRYETMLAYWTHRMQTATSFSWPPDWTEAERADLTKAQSQLQAAQAHGKSLVLATGVFDLFHDEHQNFLTKAAQTGDLLLVGVESDARVRATKGPDRPQQTQQQRRDQVAAHPGVTAAVILPENFSKPEHHRALLEFFLPQILAVSSHSPFQEKKAALMRHIGGRLEVVHEFNPRVSTSQMLESTILPQHAKHEKSAT